MTLEAIQEMWDKQAISEALVRYARGIDRHDLALAKSAYFDDATDEHGSAQGNAHDVMDSVHAVLENYEILQHRIGNVYIELRGDIALVESYHHSLHIPKEADREEHVFGRYLDRFERRHGEWKIAHRVVMIDIDSFGPRGERASFAIASPWVASVRTMLRPLFSRDERSYGISQCALATSDWRGHAAEPRGAHRACYDAGGR